MSCTVGRQRPAEQSAPCHAERSWEAAHKAAAGYNREQHGQPLRKGRTGHGRDSDIGKADSSATGKGAPRPDKTVCGSSELVGCRDAAGLLKAGILRGMTSSQVRNGWPQNVWAVDGEGIVYEAQLGNSDLGEYHGYPMKADDHFSRFVRREWKER